MYVQAAALWALFLFGAFFYVGWAKHPQARLLAAYLIFVTLFMVSAFFIFMCLIALLVAFGETGMLNSPIGTAVFLLAVFLPAFLIGSWQLRKPPRRPRVP